MKEVYSFIENLDIKCDAVIVAVSGGPDSMFLLRVLQDRLNKKIVVAHVHHNLRKESDEEAQKLEEYCKDNNLVFEMYRIEQYPNNKFSEESARKIRYEFFDKLIDKYNSDILFTAHHGDDLIETILMRLTRGSNLKGYAGIREISEDRGYKIARPLLFITKDEILNYLDSNDIWYAIDISNKSDKYKRNRIRNKVLPVLKNENNKVNIKFMDFSKKILLVDDYLRKCIYKIKDEIIVNNEIDICKFNNIDDIIKIYLLEDYLYSIYKDNIVHISNTHINIIIEAIKKENTMISLPCNKIGIVEYNSFKIIDAIDEYYDYVFDEKIVLNNNRIIEIDNNTKDASNYVIHLNSNDIKFPLHVRCRKDKDFMYIKNMNGKKSISDIFTDEKVLKEERNTYPIVTDDNDVILWIPGIKKSNLDRKKDGKYDIILRYH